MGEKLFLIYRELFVGEKKLFLVDDSFSYVPESWVLAVGAKIVKGKVSQLNLTQP